MVWQWFYRFFSNLVSFMSIQKNWSKLKKSLWMCFQREGIVVAQSPPLPTINETVSSLSLYWLWAHKKFDILEIFNWSYRDIQLQLIFSIKVASLSLKWNTASTISIYIAALAKFCIFIHKIVPNWPFDRRTATLLIKLAVPQDIHSKFIWQASHFTFPQGTSLSDSTVFFNNFSWRNSCTTIFATGFLLSAIHIKTAQHERTTTMVLWKGLGIFSWIMQTHMLLKSFRVYFLF